MSGPRFYSSSCAGEQFLVWTARGISQATWGPGLQERLSRLADSGYHIVQERRFGGDGGPVGGIVRAVAHPVRLMLVDELSRGIAAGASCCR